MSNGDCLTLREVTFRRMVGADGRKVFAITVPNLTQKQELDWLSDWLHDFSARAVEENSDAVDARGTGVLE